MVGRLNLVVIFAMFLLMGEFGGFVVMFFERGSSFFPILVY